MRLPLTKHQKKKSILHGAQLILIFLAGCLGLAVLTKSGPAGSQPGFYFALCFLSLPAIVYQVTVPIWSRAWRLASHGAYAVVDVIYTILWLAASIAMGVWNDDGMRKGAETSHATSRSCSTFLFGSVAKCQVAKASVGIGILVSLLFAVTSIFSVRAFLQHRKDSAVPSMRSESSAGYRPVDATTEKCPPQSSVGELESQHRSFSFDEKAADSDGEMEQARHEKGAFQQAIRQHSSDSTLTGGGLHPGKVAYSIPSPLKPRQLSYDESGAPSALSPTGADVVYANMMKTPTFCPLSKQ